MENIVIPRPEYPRPSFLRGEDTWQNLNGEWEFEIDWGKSGKERNFQNRESLNDKIIVPFVPESKLSGIGITDFMESVWYRRTFTVENLAEKERVLLHFGAVDNYATVWVNGTKAGDHRGGYTPFAFDVTSLLKEGENVLVVHAEDNTRDPLQPSGKQCDRYNNFMCLYTRCTGIWQTVWLEFVPKTYIKNIKITPDVANEKADVTVIFDGHENVKTLRAFAAFEGEPVADKEVNVTGKAVSFSLDIPAPILWDIGNPNLYDLNITAGDDMVATYFGMRSVATDGHKFMLNGRSLFQRLVLDQGYFEEGIYTAKSDEDFARDIELSMASGFNGARMHMKVFEPGFIYHADHMGYILWGEYPNWGLDITRTGAYEAIAAPWREQIERDFSSPAIIGWCPLNETWTTANETVRNIYFLTKTLDPSRPAIDVSGYHHSEFTDIYDVHDYVQEPEEFGKHYDPLVTGEGEAFINAPDKEVRDPALPYFVSEFGGAFFDIDKEDVAGNDSAHSWGYGEKPQTKEDFYTRLEGLCDVLFENEKICGFCFTQLTDVMQEQNGLFTFDRRAKFELDRLKSIFSKKAAIEKD